MTYNTKRNKQRNSNNQPKATSSPTELTELFDSWLDEISCEAVDRVVREYNLFDKIALSQLGSFTIDQLKNPKYLAKIKSFINFGEVNTFYK